MEAAKELEAVSEGHMSKNPPEIHLDLERSKSSRALHQLVKRTVEDMFGEADPDSAPNANEYVELAITRALGPMIERVLLETLGIDNRWSRPEIKDDSVLGTAVKRRAQTHAASIVDEFIETKGWPKLGAHEKKALERIAKETMSELLHKRIIALAEERVEQIPNEALLPIVDRVLFDKFPMLKTLEAMSRLGAEDSSEPR